jgi:hypothetical protein
MLIRFLLAQPDGLCPPEGPLAVLKCFSPKAFSGKWKKILKI